MPSFGLAVPTSAVGHSRAVYDGVSVGIQVRQFEWEVVSVRDAEFITEVQTKADLSGRDEVERAVRATVETLGEQLPDTVARPLAELLPEQLGDQLQRAAWHQLALDERESRPSRGVEGGEASWPGDDTHAGVDIDTGESVRQPARPTSPDAPTRSRPEEADPPQREESTD